MIGDRNLAAAGLTLGHTEMIEWMVALAKANNGSVGSSRVTMRLLIRMEM
jgi:electron transfer flavoprotein alpha subunit